MTDALGPYPAPGTQFAVVALTPDGMLNVRANWNATPEDLVGFLRHAADNLANLGVTSPAGLVLPGSAGF